MVVVAAEQDAVVQIGGSGVAMPPADVMGLGVPGRVRATGPRAPTIPFRQRAFLPGGEQPVPPPQIEDLTLAAQHNRDQVRVRGQPPCRAGADRAGHPIDLRNPDPGLQGVEADPDQHRHRRVVCSGTSATGEVPEHLDRRIRPHLRQGPRIRHVPGGDPISIGSIRVAVGITGVSSIGRTSVVSGISGTVRISVCSRMCGCIGFGVCAGRDESWAAEFRTGQGVIPEST